MRKFRKIRGTHSNPRAEAAVWLSRLHSDTRTEVDERAFWAWIKSDNSNAEAFDLVTQVFNDAGAEPVRREVPIYTRSVRNVERRAVLGAAAGGVGIVLTVGWGRAYAGVYRTAVGEQKHVTLSDGTEVFLDTDTRLRSLFEGNFHTVTLLRGRAHFRAALGQKQSFSVKASGSTISTCRAAFDVRLDEGRVTVVILAGEALVRTADQFRGTMSEGTRLVETARAPAVDHPDLKSLAAWQSGQVVFDDVTLADAAIELNRYSLEKLEIVDPQVSDFRISGTYRVGDNAAFAHSLASLFPVGGISMGHKIALSLRR